MIADQQFLSQDQVATTVLTLADDEQAKILNGKIIPGDRVFYPVRSHITSVPETVKQFDYSSKIAVLTIDATDEEDAKKAEEIANNVQAKWRSSNLFHFRQMFKRNSRFNFK